MKEKDPMKDFFDVNRDSFDDKELPDGLWEGIEDALPKAKEIKMVPLKAVLRIAAVVAICLAAGVALLLPTNQNPQIAQTQQVEVQEPDAFNQYPELAEAAFYYQVRIDEAEEELEEYRVDEVDFETLRMLEDELLILKADLGEHVDNERLIEAMMQIYQHKLQLLEQMLKQVKYIDSDEIYTDEVVVVSM